MAEKDGTQKTGGPEDVNGTDIPKEFSGEDREERHHSLLDLVDLAMFDIELAAWLVSHVSRGASYVVGAGPGGIGKTTTMRALLSFVPGRLPFTIALPGQVAGFDGVPSCVISHELSHHPPPAYLWDQDLRDFFALTGHGHMLVGNMHADELEEVHCQVCVTNGVSEDLFRALSLVVFVRIEGVDTSSGRIKDTSSRRYVNEIWYSDGSSAHEAVFSCGSGLSSNAPRDPAYEVLCRQFLVESIDSDIRTVGEIRRSFLDWSQRLSDSI